MKSELQMDILHMIGSVLLAIIVKALEAIIGENSLFALINLVLLILFVKSIIGYVEHKYKVKVLKFNIRKEVNER